MKRSSSNVAELIDRANGMAFPSDCDAFPDGVSIGFEALALWRVTDDHQTGVDAELVRSLIEEDQLLWDTGHAAGRSRFAACSDRGDLDRVGRVLAMFGGIAYGQGDLRRARFAEDEALSIYRTVHDRLRQGQVLGYLAMCDGLECRWHAAAIHARESLFAVLDTGERSFEHRPLLGLAWIATQVDRATSGALLLGSVDEHIRCSGQLLLALDLETYTQTRQVARRLLGQADFAETVAIGRNLDTSDWLRIAEEVVFASKRHDSRPPKAESHGGDALTAREHDVLRLLVEGRSNPEIADELYVGVGTAKTHVAHILAKLGAPTRAAAATLAVRQGLI
jgi:DNA-binding CsgD family transcriptional regulator